MIGGILIYNLQNMGYGSLSPIQSRMLQLGNVISPIALMTTEVLGAMNNIHFPRVCRSGCSSRTFRELTADYLL